MHPVSPYIDKNSPPVTPLRPPTSNTASTSTTLTEEAVPIGAPTLPLPMSWKDRGDYHLNRKEIDLAVESYTKALQAAEEQNSQELIGDSLKDLGRAFLEKEQWPFAAKIFNGAYAIYQKTPQTEKAQQATLSLMAEVERRFLEKVCGIRSAPNPKVYLERRQALQALRQASQVLLKQDEPAQNILMVFSQSISHFLEEILKSGYAIFGKPPCKHTLIGLGSLARKEMSPFSDLEFALLVKRASPNDLEYFRKMVRWLEIQVINLGETAIKILDEGHESPVVRGFSFDDGGNTPLGKQGYIELIKTPQELAQFQSERFYQEDLILSNVLRGADIIVGSESLYKQYIQAVQALLTTKSVNSPIPICQERSINILRGHLLEFEPRVDRKKEEAPVYNIKVELYRLPSFLIAGLADFFGIGEQNTWKRLEALVRQKILSPEGANHLKEALATTMHLRIRCHLHYGKECDDAFHPSMQLKGGRQLQNVFVLTDTDIDKIIEIYRVIFPLHRIFKQLCQTRNFAELAKETFYDSSLQAQAEAYENLFQYDKAKTCYQQAIALNPEDAEIQLQFVNMLWRLAEHSQAKEYATKAFTLGIKQNNEKVIARTIIMHGLIYNELGNSKKAIKRYKKALKIVRRVYGNETIWVTACLCNLGAATKDLGDVVKAIEYYNDALRISKKIYGDAHLQVTTELIGLGLAWQELGYPKRAIGYLEEALSIITKFYGDVHPDAAVCLGSLGSAWQDLKDARKAIELLNGALRIGKMVYGNEHPHVATTLSHLSLAWRDLGKAKQAKRYAKEALRIGKIIYGDEHPEVATSLNNIGLAWRDLGNAKKAIEYYEEALRIGKKVYGDEHPRIAIRLNNLAVAWQDLKDVKKALEYYAEALRIFKQAYGDEHPHTRAVQSYMDALK